MDMIRKLRQRILLNKEKLRDNEVFCSTRYSRMLKAIAREITDTGFDNVIIHSGCEKNAAGRFTGEQIVIHTCNALTRSFPTRELKNRSIVGILAHECGHLNYSSIDARKKYLLGIKEGIWYPRAPYPENKEERKALEELKGYFKKKDKTALAVIYEAARYIHNILEDRYVENKMCARFRGSVAKGIRQNRCRNLELTASLKEQIGNGIDIVTVMINLILQYTFSGSYNNWDGYDGEILNVLESMEHIIDNAVIEDSGSTRIIATNQILLKMWKILQEKIEEIRQEQEERDREADNGSNDEAENESKSENDHRSDDEAKDEIKNESGGDALGNFLKKLCSQIPDFISSNDCEGTSKGIPDDVEWNGNWEADESRSDESQPGEADAEAGQGETDRPKGEQTAGSQVQQGENSQMINADDQLHAVIYEIAKEQALHSIYDENMQEMNRELEDVEFHDGHRDVQKILIRSEHISDETLQRYESVKDQLKTVMHRLMASVYPILKMKEGRIEHKLLIGKRIDVRNITDRAGRVFQKKHFPGQNSDTAVGILIDMSESMWNRRIVSAQTASLCIYEFCRMAQIPITIYGHHTDGYAHQRLSDERVFLHSCAEFEVDEHDRYRILDLKCRGANRDGTALIYMGAKMLNRYERQKILLLISDGLPNANYYNNEGAKQDLKKIKKDLKRKGITFMAAAIGADKQAIEEIYQESFIDISDLNKMPSILSKKMLSLIRRE